MAEGIGGLFHSSYYNRKGEPIPAEEWSRLCVQETWREGVDSYTRVKDTDLGSYVVSTVWLGINERFGEGPPLIFATMVLGDDSRYVWVAEEFDQTRRYATEAEALAGHEEMCLLIRATMQEEPGLVTNQESTNSEEGR